MGDGCWVEWTERVESKDRDAPVRCTSEVHWGCGGCKEGVCPEGGGSGECLDVCEGLSGSISGRHHVQSVASGVAVYADAALVGKGAMLLVVPCWRGGVDSIDIGVSTGGLGGDWEEAISTIGEVCLIAYTNDCRDELGRVAGGWCGPRGAEVSVLVGKVATVWDREITGMRLTLESLQVAPVLLLSDSPALISVVCNEAACR